jgi:hypothetical protein
MLAGRLYYQPPQSGFKGFVGFTKVLDGFCFEQSHIHAPLWIRNKLLLLMLTAKSKIFLAAASI